MAGNGNSGRRQQPTALHVLHGTRPRPRRQRNDKEPQPAPVAADFDTPPDELQGSPIAMTEWQRLAPMMRKCGLVTNAERASLIALCTEWARWTEANTQLRVVGMLIKGKNGMPVTNPYWRIARESLTQCIRLWTELGLTPTSRTRIQTALPEDVPASRWADFSR